MNKKPIRSIKDLLTHNLIKEQDVESLENVANQFSVSLNETMHQLIDKQNQDDPIAKQFVPSVDELNISPIELIDPIGDNIHTKVKGIVHRHGDRCLFTPVHICPIHCRFCFRKEKIGDSEETLTPIEFENAYDYIQNHKEIWEVILTGGDPLILNPNMLKKIIERLNQIEHVAIIRIHTRIPVVEPKRITEKMVSLLRNSKPIYIVLHANHPKEFSNEAILACQALVNAGIPMLSQTTLLKNINDNIEVLSSLMKCFIKNRIKPYYLHHADLVKGTAHFRTTIAEGQQLMKQLRKQFSGLCQPTYVLDIPGGYGKIPIGPLYIQNKSEVPENNVYLLEDYLGMNHDYP